MNLCVGTRVPRHSAGGVDSSYIHVYMVHIVCNAHVQVIEAENSVTLAYIVYQYKVFIALTWLFRKIMGFVYAYEYTYQDHEYVIRTMNTEHAQGTLYTEFPAPACTQACTQSF